MIIASNSRQEQIQSNQCQTPGVKFESKSKSLKINKNQEIRKTNNNKGEPRKMRTEQL